MSQTSPALSKLYSLKPQVPGAVDHQQLSDALFLIYMCSRSVFRQQVLPFALPLSTEMYLASFELVAQHCNIPHLAHKVNTIYSCVPTLRRIPPADLVRIPQ